MAIVEKHEGEGPPQAGYCIWEQFTIRDGLPDMKIESLFEDTKGNMWIGTHDRGVVRYDGYEFKTFSRENGMSGDGVFSILEDADGNMWFGTNTGLVRYDGTTFDQIEPDQPCSLLWGSCMDAEGNLWFGLERRPNKPAAVCRWDGRRAEVVELGTRTRESGYSVHTIIPNGHRGVLCGGHGLYRASADGVDEIGSEVPEAEDVKLLMAAPEDALFLLSPRGVFVSRGEVSCLSFSHVLATFHATAAAESDGVMWVGGELRCPSQSILVRWLYAAHEYSGPSMAHVLRPHRSIVDRHIWYGSAVGRAEQICLCTTKTTGCRAEKSDASSGGKMVLCGSVQQLVWRNARAVASLMLGVAQGEIVSLFATRDGDIWTSTRSGKVFTDGADGFDACAEVPQLEGLDRFFRGAGC